MESTTGSLALGHESSSSQSSARAIAIEATRLLMLGAVAVALHAATRRRIELGPGHQGIIWMALLMIGRVTSRGQWAGVTAAAGAAGATMLPFWRLGDPFLWLAYVLAGAVVDVGYAAFSRWRDRLWMLAVLGGAAQATKPLIRVVLSQLGFRRYESLLAGLPFPLATHFLFGTAGALVGCGLLYLSRSLKRAR